ncbi:cell division cycle 6 [Oratosquilla oratoria]|uniref:cell division cycle 6 n=1 Tax=Oratosquilla oratoria TaxID=337810 RepID=UPI003F775939
MSKQELINFPIRKTRNTSKAVETIDLGCSPRRSARHLKAEVKTLPLSPHQRKSRLKEKTESEYTSSSPTNSDNENTPPKGTKKRDYELQGKLCSHEDSSPSKKTLKDKFPVQENKATPNARRRLLTEEASPPSPSRITTACEARLSPIKFAPPDLISPKKTPLKCSNILNSPIKSPARALFSGHQPVRCSPRKHSKSLNSPIKRLDYGTPKKSPRKLIQEDVCSPRRSPRKLPASPQRFMSPSSLVSKLSVSSPGKKVPSVSLSKPNVSAYRAVKQSMNTGTPSCLLCRETQIRQMKEFLDDHITSCKPGSLYVSGAPGTGKTACLTSILSEMKGAKMKLKPIFLNCMSLRTSGAIYSRVAEELGVDVQGSERDAVRVIEKYLQSAKSPVLIVLDEMDQLDSRNQEVLYTIFEWPALEKSKLILIGIANALDLTDRVLPRLQSRPTFKPKLLNFPPYTKPEIVKILNQRIEEAGLGEVRIIKPAAIMFLAAKVASVAGDVRKALDVCRRAVELCETQARRQSLLRITGSPVKSPSKQPRIKMVELPQIMSIFNEVYGSRVTTAVTQAPQSFPLQQKVLVCSVLLMLKHAKSKDITLGKLHTVYNNVCKKRNVQYIDQTEFLSVCVLLESRGILLVKKNKDVRSSKISLRLNAEEAEQALGDRNLLVSVMDDKESLGKLARA